MNSKIKLALFITSISLSFLSLYFYSNDALFQKRWIILGIWLLSLVISLFLCVFWSSGKKEVVKANHKEIMIITILVIVSVVLRFVYLNNIPTINGDETRDTGFMPMKIISGQEKDFFNYNGSIGQLFYVVSTIPHLIFGDTVFSIRFFSALIGVITVVIIYFFSKKYFGKNVAFISASLLVSYHVILHFNRSEFLNSTDAFFSILLVWCLNNLYSGSPVSYLLMGLLCGITLHFYTGVRAIMFFCLIATFSKIIFDTIILFYRRESPKKIIKEFFINVFFILSGFFIATGPTLHNIYSHKNEFLAKGGGDFFTRIPFLQWGKSELIELLNRYISSILAYISVPIDFHYKWGGPFLIFPASLFFIWGIYFVLLKAGNVYYTFLIFWLLIPPFVNSAIVNNLNFSHRLLSVIPAMLIVAAIGIERFVSIFNTKYIKIILALVIIVITFQNIKLYFFDRVWENAIDINTLISTEVGYFLRNIDNNNKIYFVGNDNYSSKSVPSLNYISKKDNITDVNSKDIVQFLQNYDSKMKRSIFIFPQFESLTFDLVTNIITNGEITLHSRGRNLVFYSLEVNSD